MPTRIAKYEVLRRLGQGAMGEVFLARDPLIGREVAIKTIAAAHAEGEEARERFLREARAAGALSHPNLVTIHEFGEDQGLLYLVMEYVPGEDLHSLLALKALQPREVLEILAQVCEGLGYAHGKGVLHRDVKPSNIRVSRPGGRLQAKVMDFGIARIIGSDFTGTGTLLGTFGYMAPEYIQTGRPDPRSDLFAVGVILYEALAGDRPFKGDTTATVLYRIVHDSPPPLEPKAIVGISPAVRAILAMALAKEPDARFAAAEEMAAALRAAMDPSWRGLGAGTGTIQHADAALPTAALRAGPTAMVPAAPPTTPARSLTPWIAAGALAAAALGGYLLWPRKAPAAATAAQAAPPAAPSQPPVAKPEEAAAKPAASGSEPAPAPAAKPASAAPVPKRTEAKPEAAPAPEKPAGPATLDEAALLVDRDPTAALAFLDRFLKEDPGNLRAWMLKIVCNYDAGDVEGLKAAFKDAHDHGVQRKLLLMFPRYRTMLRHEHDDPKLPPKLHEFLFEGLPAPGEPKARPGIRRRPS